MESFEGDALKIWKLRWLVGRLLRQHHPFMPRNGNEEFRKANRAFFDGKVWMVLRRMGRSRAWWLSYFWVSVIGGGHGNSRRGRIV